MARNLAIVDIQTNFLACRESYGPLSRVDYVKLKTLFKENEEDIVDPIAYVLASPYHDDKRFVKFLKKHGYILMRRFAQVEMPTSSHGSEEKEVTFKNRSWIESMVWESIKMIPKYDNIYIVSGNGQFCSVASAAKQQSKKVTVVSFKSSLQEQLSKMADEVIYLDQNYIYDSSLFQAMKEQKENDETKV